MSLDDIWSEPLTEEFVTGTRKKGPLFLPDDSDQEVSDLQDGSQNQENENSGEATHTDKGELDAIFADIENEDLFADIDKPIDLEAMQRRAKAKITATQPPTATQTVDDSQTNAKKDNPSQRRPLPKLDEERLLGQDGFPQLLKEYKTFKVSGKGREAQDLERLFRLYHSWTHRLFPKYRFQDTVERVEKLCRSRRMTVNLRVWRDEARGLMPNQQPEDDGSESEEDRINELRLSPSGAQSTTSSRPGTPTVRSTRSGSAAPSVPSSGTDMEGMEDMEDIDAMIREEEELIQELNGAGSMTSKPYRIAEADEEEALWAAAEGTLPVSQIKQAQFSASLEDDDSMWAAVDDIQKSLSNQNEPLIHSESPSHSARTDENNNGLRTLGGDWDDMYE